MGTARGVDEPAPGDVLGGRYEILEELGRGGMATVYKGRDLRLSRTVAVKVFRGGFADAVDPRRTAQEMRLLAGVNHPAIVSVLDASNGDGRFGTYLVMELVVGDDLGALLRRSRGPLAADFARRIVADIASALEVLHGQGVVHRDVKPGNILVSSRAGQHGLSGVTAKLTDFGIAQMVDGTAITAPDSILGTAAYLSPEQVRGARIRPASDVYSLGLVLLEALTGHRAFPGPATEAAVARLTRPPALPADASPALADLLSRMTALDPSARPRAAEVAEALRDQLAGAITAPDALHTAEVPRPGLPVPVPVSAAPDGDETLPQERLLTPAGGVLLRAASLDTGPRPRIDRAGARRPQAAARFPTMLAATASALAAAVAGIIIATSAGLTSTPLNANAVGGDAAAAASVPAASAPAAVGTTAPLRAVQGGAAVATTPHAAPSTQAAPRSPAPTRTTAPSASAAPTPAPTGSVTASPVPTSTPTGTPTAPSTGPTTSPSTDPSPSGTASGTPSASPSTQPPSTSTSSAPTTDGGGTTGGTGVNTVALAAAPG